MQNRNLLKQNLFVVPALIISWLVGYFLPSFVDYFFLWFISFVYMFFYGPILFLQYRHKNDKKTFLVNKIFRILNLVTAVVILLPVLAYVLLGIYSEYSDPNISVVQMTLYRIYSYFTSFDGLEELYTFLSKNIFYMIVAALIILSSRSIKK